MTPLTTKQAIDAQVGGVIDQAIDDLNLGTAAQKSADEFATAAQGAKADTALQQASNLSDLDSPDTALANLGAGAKGAEVFKGAGADEIHDALARDWSNGLADTPQEMSVPQFIGRDVIDLDTFRTTDTGDFWPMLKSLLETDNSIRNDIIRGARLTLRGGRAWNALTMARIGLPQYLHLELTGGAFIDFSQAAPSTQNMFAYDGRYGLPTRPVDADYFAGTSWAQFGEGVVASRGWKTGDRLLIRATEGLTDMNVGAFQTMSMPADQPTSFTFYTPGASYAIGDGVISVDNGRSYRCAIAHTAGATMNLANFVLTGWNATGEDVYIEAIIGDRVYFSNGFRYNYPQAARPVFTKYEDQGRHRFTNLNAYGNHPDDVVNAGVWATGRAYVAGEIVFASSGIGGPNRYVRCMTNHTSSTFATDLAAGRWADMFSDRMFRFTCTDSVLIEGGRIERFSGPPMNFSAVANLTIRDHVGVGTNKRGNPGGYLSIAAAASKTIVENTIIYGAGQPFMTTDASGDYGVAFGSIFKDCIARGGHSGFTQHWQEDGAVYDNCEHDGGVVSGTTGGTGFDIRTPSTLRNCRVLNCPGRAMVLRHNFMGFGRVDASARGTVLDGFRAHGALTGIQLDDQMFNPGPGTIGWPDGYLHIRNSELTQIGGTGTAGAISLIWTQQSSAGVYPLLGKVSLNDVLVEMRANQHAIRIAGRWQEPELKAVKVRPTAGFTPSGAFRGLLVYDGGVPSGENRPINAIIHDDCDFGSRFGFNVPNLTGIHDRALLTAASGNTLIIDQADGAVVVTGTTQIRLIQAGARCGKFLALEFQDAVTISHNNNGGGGANAVLLNGSTNWDAPAGATLLLISNGTRWKEVSRMVP